MRFEKITGFLPESIKRFENFKGWKAGGKGVSHWRIRVLEKSGNFGIVLGVGDLS